MCVSACVLVCVCVESNSRRFIVVLKQCHCGFFLVAVVAGALTLCVYV